MLQWAVGSIITILVIFLTANFFTMRKLRKEEIEKIKQELITDLKSEDLAKIKGELRTELISLQQNDIGELRANINELKNKFNEMQNSFIVLEGELKELEAKNCFKNGQYNLAFSLYIQAINLYIEADHYEFVKVVLVSLEKTAAHLKHLFVSEVPDFNEMCERLKQEDDEQVKRIHKKLGEIKHL